MTLIPMVVEQSPRGERSFDIYSGCWASASSSSAPRWMTSSPTSSSRDVALESEDDQKDISLYINSPAASSTPAWRSTTRCSSSSRRADHLLRGGDVDGSLLLAGGAAGKRMALPTAASSSTSHGRIQGQATDIEIHARETLELRRHLDDIYAGHTGQSVSRVHETWTATATSPEQAREYGLIDASSQVTSSTACAPGSRRGRRRRQRDRRSTAAREQSECRTSSAARRRSSVRARPSESGPSAGAPCSQRWARSPGRSWCRTL